MVLAGGFCPHTNAGVGELGQDEAKLGLNSGKDGHGHLEATDVVGVVGLGNVGASSRDLGLTA